MTNEDREMLRTAIDRRRRELLAQETRLRSWCSGCGGPIDGYTDGCGHCADRRRRRWRREHEPGFREREGRTWRASRARRRAERAA